MGLFGDSAKKAAQRQYQYNLKLQQQQQQWNEYMYKNRYQMQVQDLKSAGINPLFGMGQAPTVTSGLNSTSMADDVGQQNNKFQQILSLLNFGQELSAKRAQTKLLENQANTESINTNLKSLEVIQQQINNLKGQKDLKYYDKEKLAYLKNLESQTYNNIQQGQNAITDSILKGTMTARQKLENKPLERYEKWIKENPKLGNALEGMNNGKDILTTAVALIGGGAIGLSALKRKLLKRKVGF